MLRRIPLGSTICRASFQAHQQNSMVADEASLIPVAERLPGFLFPHVLPKGCGRLYALDRTKSRPAPVMGLDQGWGRKDIEIPRRVVPLF
jgi:hypothetical protein